MQKRFCRKCFLLSFVALFALICGYWASTLGDKPTLDTGELQATLKQATLLPADFRQVPEFAMYNQHQQTVGRELFLDTWSLVFFGYTSCPDICPVSMAVLKQAQQIIAEAQTQSSTQAPDTPHIVFISVDPMRDTAERLKAYMDYFDKDFIGLSGDQSEILALTRTLGIAYKIGSDAETNPNYLVDHSAVFLLINPSAGLQAIFSAPHDPETIASDYLKIRQAVN